jgi:hypothetical protein
MSWGNKERTAAAEAAAATFAEISGQDMGADSEERGDILTDLLCNLRHWAEANDLDWGEADRKGQYHYLFEVNEEAES